MRVKILLIALLLSGCAAVPGADGNISPSAGRIKTGESVEAPWGYLELCAREPHVPECRGR